MHRLLTSVAAVATLLVAVSCLPASESEGGCATDADCPDAGLVCELQWCITPGDNHVGLRARIVPPANSDLLEQHVPSLDLSTGAAVNVTLIEPVLLYGRVDRAEDPQPNEAGELTARTDGDLPGFGYKFTAPSFEGLDDNDVGYEMGLLPGRDYEVTFQPDDPTRPPYTFTLLAADVVAGRLDIALPALSEHVMFKGLARWDDGLPIAGASVTVFLPDGRALPGLEAADNGHFEVLLPPGTAEVSVRVTAPSAGPLFPDLLVEGVATDPNPVWDEVVVAALAVPSLPSGYGQFLASIEVRAPSGTALPFVTLVLFGHLEGGVLKRTASTDDNGLATFEALPGAWEVLVKPPAQSAWASAIHKVNLQLGEAGAAPSTEVLTVESKATLALQVTDHTGEAVVSGEVVAKWLPDPGANDALVISPHDVSADLGADGIAALLLDEGTWDIRVLPDGTTGAPAQTITRLTVDGDLALPIDLPDPGLAHVTVLTPAGDPIENATVELYLEQDQPGPLGSRPPVLHSGITGPSGHVDLLVPFVP